MAYLETLNQKAPLRGRGPIDDAINKRIYGANEAAILDSQDNIIGFEIYG